MNLFIVVGVVTRPLLWDGSMVEDHGASEAGKLPWARTTDCRATENYQRASGTKSRSWTVQNEISGVFGWMTEGAAWRILDSANSSEIKA